MIIILNPRYSLGGNVFAFNMNTAQISSKHGSSFIWDVTCVGTWAAYHLQGSAEQTSFASNEAKNAENIQAKINIISVHLN